MILAALLTAGAVAVGTTVALVLRASAPRRPLERRRRRHRCRRLHVITTFPDREIDA